MKKVFLLAGGLFSLLFTSCTPNDSSTPSDLNTINPVDVYVAGANNNIASYWKNGVAVKLGKGVSGASGANSVFVSGSDVYVAGAQSTDTINPSLGNNIAKYWKNGVSKNLTDGTHSAGATSITVLGNDVYVAGQMSTGINTPYDAEIAVYWKNGVVHNLTDGTTVAYTSSITVVGNDVYVTGGDAPIATSNTSVAKYWKNGSAVNLSDGTTNAGATSIAVVGNDVYVAGFENNIAKYWKNGTAVNLPSVESEAFATSIAVVGTDVYVCGSGRPSPLSSDATKAKYWKNGVEVSLGSSRTFSYASSIKVLDNNVYITGQNYEYQNDSSQIAALWINGVLTTAGKNAYGSSIFVTPHQ